MAGDSGPGHRATLKTRRNVLFEIASVATAYPVAAGAIAADEGKSEDEADALARKMQETRGGVWSVSRDKDFILIARKY